MKNSKLKNAFEVAKLDSLKKGEIINVNEQMAIRGGQAALAWQPLCTINGACPTTNNTSCTPTTTTPTQPSQPTTTVGIG